MPAILEPSAFTLQLRNRRKEWRVTSCAAAWGWTAMFPDAVVLMLLLAVSTARCAEQRYTTPPNADGFPAAMRFEPGWREKSDCGPCALYVLMRLEGYNITLEHVKATIQIDSKTGCSLADLAKAADELGLPAEIRFVTPHDLPKLAHPCIHHLNGSLQSGIGHFAVITGYSKEERKFHYIDSDHDTYHHADEGLIARTHSGFVLLPVRRNYHLASTAASAVLLFSAAFLWIRRR